MRYRSSEDAAIHQENTYTGSLSLVSAALALCNKHIGFPTQVTHGSGGNIYVEYQLPHSLITLFTSTQGGSYEIKLIGKIQSENISDMYDLLQRISSIDEGVKRVTEHPDYLSAFLIEPEDRHEKRKEDEA